MPPRGAGLLLAAWMPLASASDELIFANGFNESCLDDSDDDRLDDCTELTLQLDRLAADTDGDGLKDGDEVLGTVAGLDLPALGVDPRHSDLLVEMDWTDDGFECFQHSHRPRVQMIGGVRDFFASAPVPNPDGTTGINFIADYGQGGPFTGGNFVPMTDGITGRLEVPFYDRALTQMAANRFGYFRYQLHGHRMGYVVASSGQGNIGGDYSVVTLRCLNTAQNVRNTIIHELGHNLGLGHGGGDDCNGKPNYNSLMNYNHQFPGLDINCDGLGDGIDLLGYSEGVLPPLVDGALIEPLGICPPDHAQHRAIDWNGNGVIDPEPVASKFPLAVDCGQSGTASDFDDYAALSIAPFSAQGGAAPPIPDGDASPFAPQLPVPIRRSRRCASLSSC